MGSLLAHFRRVIDAELAGIQARIGNVGFRVALLAAAGIVALLGLLALEFCAFLALASVMKPAWAALLTAIGTFVVAGIIAFIASNSKGEARLHEIELRKRIARRDMQQDVERLMSVASMATGTLAALKNLRRSPPATVTVAPIAPAPAGMQPVLLASEQPPAIWRGSKRNGIIAAVATLGFAVGVSPALRRSVKRMIS